jgi:type III pantothenate kinase
MTKQRVLLLDAGNSRIKWAWASAWCEPKNAAMPATMPAAIPATLKGSTADAVGECASSASSEVLFAALGAWLQTRAGSGHTEDTQQQSSTHGIASATSATSAATAALGACVAGDAVRGAIASALARHGIAIEWVRSTLASPLEHPLLRNDYATPHTLGVDRYLAGLGLVAQQAPFIPDCPDSPRRTPPHWVLATFGTATTVDALCWDAAAQRYAFKGGIILAGLHTAWRSVSASTAQLPLMDAALLGSEAAAALLHTVPNTTAQALLAGAVHAQVGAVIGMLEVLEVQGAQGLPGTGAQLALAGGSAVVMQPFMLPHFPRAQRLDYPVLLGLAALLHCRGVNQPCSSDQTAQLD